MAFYDTWRSGGTGRGAYSFYPRVASDVPLTITGLAGQAANLLTIKDSLGSTLLSVGPTGDLTVAGAIIQQDYETATAIHATGELQIDGASTLNGSVLMNSTLYVVDDATFADPVTFNDYVYFNANVRGGVFRLLEQLGSPTYFSNGGCVYSKDSAGIKELQYLDSAGSVIQMTSGGAIYGDAIFWADDETAKFGNTKTSPDVTLNWETADADAHYFNIAVSSASRNIIISEDRNVDWGHAASNNPTLWIHSADATDVSDYVSVAHDQSNAVFSVGTGVFTFNDSVTPTGNDGGALGAATVSWSDLFLASGAVINFSNGDVTITHSSNDLAVTGGSVSLSRSDAGAVLSTASSANDMAANTLLAVSKTGTSGSTAFTGDVANIGWTHTYSAAATIDNTANGLDVSRALTSNHASAAVTVSGALVSLNSTNVQTLGTMTDTGSVLSLTQGYTTASGAVISISNSGTGADITGTGSTWSITKAGTVYVGNSVGSSSAGFVYVQYDAIGVNSTLATLLQNTTAAANGAQQYAPMIGLRGQGWKTDATAASQPVDWALRVVPVQGTSAPSGQFHFMERINNGSWLSRANLSSSGTITVNNNIVSSSATALIYTSGSDGSLTIKGNRSAASGTSDVTITGQATRTAGSLLDVQNNASSVFIIGYGGAITQTMLDGNQSPAVTINLAATSAGFTTGTEVSMFDFNANASALTWAAGALTTERVFRIRPPAMQFLGASTCTTAVTFVVDSSMWSGSNSTITNNYAAQIGGTNTLGAAQANSLTASLDLPAHTLTYTGSTGITSTGPAQLRIGQITLTDSSALTITNAASLYIAAAPVAAGSVTLTNTYSIWTAAGLNLFERDALAATTPVAGLQLYNATAAINGTQQNSPGLLFSGFGWKTDATAASQQCDMIIAQTPEQGASEAASTLQFYARVNYPTVTTFTSCGSITYAPGYGGFWRAHHFQVFYGGLGLYQVSSDATLGLRGNKAAGSTDSADVRVFSAATRTAGVILDVQNNATSLFSVGFNGGTTITQAALQVAATPTAAFTVTGGAHGSSTPIAASVEATDVYLNLARTVTFATGALATQRAINITAPTYAFAGASVVTTAATVAISGPPVAGANATLTDTYAFWVDSGSARFDGRILGAQGADVASANDLTLGDGQYFDITGTTQINGIAVAGWTAGSLVMLQFDSTPTVKHNTAASAGFASLLLAAAGDFAATAGDTLSLVFDGTYWREIARTVI